MSHLEIFISFVLVAGMTVILGIILFILKFRRELNHRLLALFFASVFFFLLYYFGYLYRSRYIGGVAFLFGNGMGLLIGPLFMHYILSLGFNTKKVLRSFLIHLIPFAINLLCLSLPRALNMLGDFLPQISAWYLPYSDYINIIENCIALGYLFYSLHLLRRLHVFYTESFSNPEGKDLDWCRQLILVLIVIMILDIGFSLYELYFPPLAWNIGIIPAFLFVGIIVLFAYRGMSQAKLLFPQFMLEEADESPVQHEIQSTTASAQMTTPGALSVYSDAEIDALKDRLHTLLREKKPYLNESLTLSELADMMEITDKKLSELLNKHIQTSFYDLINDFRVETVKEKMNDPASRNYTLLALAFESGFKSKTSFNRVFKQKTGLSPSAYYTSVQRHS